MTIRSKTIKSERGSVLMEFVLVAPLYLCLFGAMFLTGELLLSRSRLWNNDRFLAWLAQDRHEMISVTRRQAFHERLREEARKQFYLLTDGGEDGWSFDGGGGLIGETAWVGHFPSATSTAPPGTVTTTYITSNAWLALYQSQMQLQLTKIPGWIRGPLALVHIFGGEPSPFEDAVYDFYRGGEDVDNRNNDRHYVFKRVASSSPLYDRTVASEELIKSGILWKVVGDAWPSSNETELQAASSTDPYTGGLELKHPRVLAGFGQ